ncbi:MAG: methyltransferase [Shimia sp.]|uniref:RsmB/NOP family class I SAM-dependent RNA methyltransferase n=1 Tax=Shimia sp. TaxID=1954381 RepID=UPI003B8E2298
MSNSGYYTRRSAVRLLDKVMEDGRLLNDLIQSGGLSKLEPADRARAQRLALDTLRNLERADRVLQKHMKKTPDLHVHNVLRLATVELCLGGAAHGVVNDAVNIVAKNKRTAGMKGLVNAVLRKVDEKGQAEWDKLRVPRLPKWLRKPLAQAYGAETMLDIEAAHFAGAPLDLTVKEDAEGIAEAVGGFVLPNGSVRIADAGQVTALAGFKQGQWWVQDAAASMAARVLNAQPGETVLDLCSAPGGKTMQVAAAGAVVTAVDDSASRMERLEENLKRVQLNANVVVGDVMAQKGQYDAILLDAPCSATGTIRRHPDLPFAKDGSEFGDLIGLQEVFLDHAIGLLKPGGRLVFCTCSLLPDEGEVQVEEAAERWADVTVDREAVLIDGVEPEWITEEGGLRLRPDYWADKGGMDGFYVAMLRKGK